MSDDRWNPDEIVPNRRQARRDIFTIAVIIVAVLGLFIGTIFSEVNLWTTTGVIICTVILVWIVSKL